MTKNDEDNKVMNTEVAKAFLEHPKWATHKEFVVDYLRAMANYLEKNPGKSVDPFLEFFTDLMTILKHEQERLDFETEMEKR